jgi:hypothetical protein
MFGQKGKIIPKKTKSVIHPVKCTLEDLYSGKTFKIKGLDLNPFIPKAMGNSTE